jgi:hypothetical protein
MALVAPAEYYGGRDGLGMSPVHALAVPGMVEGFLFLALLAGRLVPLALALTASSMLLGVLRSAADHGVHGLDWLAVAQSLGITVAAVIVLAGTNNIRERSQAAAADAAARAAAAERERNELQRAAEQAERTAAAERAEREREAERAHVRELQRTRAYADGERARLEAEQLAAERAHALALAQTHAERSPERPERSPRPPSARRAATRLDDVTARRREQVQGAWSAREHSDRPMTGPEVAQALGVSKGRARGIIADWRADQRRQQEAAR